MYKKKEDSTISYLQKLNSFGDTAAIDIVNFLLNVDMEWNVKALFQAIQPAFYDLFLYMKKKIGGLYFSSKSKMYK